MSARRSIVSVMLVGWGMVVFAGCHGDARQVSSQVPPIQVTKEPVDFATRTFDPATPPAEMPPLSPGELAVCDSNFTSSASLRGESHAVDGMHATLTVTGVKVTLQAKITIWTPPGASAHVMEHEQGHQQISEYYYKTADKLAHRIAETYVGRQVPIEGSDLNEAANTELRRLAGEFTAEYGKQLNPDPAQQIYDNITDHSRNETPASEAVATAIKDAEIEAPHPVADAATN